MMWKKMIVGTMVGAVFLSGFHGNFAEAAQVMVTAKGSYTIGDTDTRQAAKQAALNEAKRMAVEQAGVLVSSSTEMNMGEVNADKIKSAAMARVTVQGTPEFNFLNQGLVCEVIITAVVNTDGWDEEVKAMMKSGSSNAAPQPSYQQPQPAPVYQQPQQQETVPDQHEENINAVLNKMGAVDFKGHKYKVFDTSMRWDEAKKFCENTGGHLVTIASAAEQEFVKKLVINRGKRNCYWLGAGRSVDGFIWLDGTDFKYNHWADHQPDNWDGNENAVMMYRKKNPLASATRPGDWNDVNYEGIVAAEDFFGLRNFGFVCEWDD